MEQVEFWYDAEHKLNEREEKAVRSVELTLDGLEIREIYDVLGHVFHRLVRTTYHPHWLITPD